MPDVVAADKAEDYQQLMTRRFGAYTSREVLALNDDTLYAFVTNGVPPLCDDGFVLAALKNSARAVLLFDAGERQAEGSGLLAIHAHEQGVKSPLSEDELEGVKNALNGFMGKIDVLVGDRVLGKPNAADAALGVAKAVCVSPYFVTDAIADRNPSRFKNGGDDCTVSGVPLDTVKKR